MKLIIAAIKAFNLEDMGDSLNSLASAAWQRPKSRALVQVRGRPRSVAAQNAP